jgi:hypothetical protein
MRLSTTKIYFNAFQNPELNMPTLEVCPLDANEISVLKAIAKTLPRVPMIITMCQQENRQIRRYEFRHGELLV